MACYSALGCGVKVVCSKEVIAHLQWFSTNLSKQQLKIHPTSFPQHGQNMQELWTVVNPPNLQSQNPVLLQTYFVNKQLKLYHDYLNWVIQWEIVLVRVLIKSPFENLNMGNVTVWTQYKFYFWPHCCGKNHIVTVKNWQKSKLVQNWNYSQFQKEDIGILTNFEGP